MLAADVQAAANHQLSPDLAGCSLGATTPVAPALVAAAPPARAGESYKHRRTAGEVHRCKKGHRSEIKPDAWGNFGYGGPRGEEVLSRPLDLDGVQTLPIPRIRRCDVTPEEFFARFALPRRPCIIEGGIEDWPAMQEWSIERLLSKFRHASLKVGEDDKGRKLRMKLKYFVDYMRHQRDDSPLYLFETRIENEPQARKVLDDYKVPDLFPHDFFDLVNAQAKPPFRWWSIGPRRSGTTVHSDPLGTAAWNAVTHGRKRWVLFEPSVPGRLAKGKDFVNKKTEDDEAIMYFDFILPRIKAKHPEVRVYEADQGPGEVIFVPSEWWHGVLNLEDTVAVTQNYVGYDNFDLVWMQTRKGRKKLANLWLRNMLRFAPPLFQRALALNRRDGFLMRGQRGPNDSDESSSSSSSSESSSDSSSDAEEDLDFRMVSAASPALQPPWLAPAPLLPAPAPPPRPPDGSPPEAVATARAAAARAAQAAITSQPAREDPSAPPRKRLHGPMPTSENAAFVLTEPPLLPPPR